MQLVSLFINQLVHFTDENSEKKCLKRKPFDASVTSVLIHLINKKTFSISVEINQHKGIWLPTSNFGSGDFGTHSIRYFTD